MALCPWAERRRARRGFVGALGRVLFALGFTVVATQVAVTIALVVASEPVARHQVSHLDGSLPAMAHGEEVATQCTLGSGRVIVVPPAVPTRRGLATDLGVDLPSVGQPTTIVCEADIVVVQNRIVGLSWIVRAEWPLYVATVVTVIGLALGWPRRSLLRWLASPG